MSASNLGTASAASTTADFLRRSASEIFAFVSSLRVFLVVPSAVTGAYIAKVENST
jgi:hypothetical protein